MLRPCIKDFTAVFLHKLDRQNESSLRIQCTSKNDEFAADINARHKKACTYMVLLGHPGIGKSMALNFLVHNLLKVGRSVVVLKNNVGATSVHVFNCADETVDVTKWNALPLSDPVVKCLMDAHDETQPPPQQHPVVLQDGHQIEYYLPSPFLIGVTRLLDPRSPTGITAASNATAAPTTFLRGAVKKWNWPTHTSFIT